jgi:hypothetical protein
MGQTKLTQADDGSEQPRTHKGRIEATQLTNGQGKLAEGAKETASNPITQEPGGTKTPTVQEAGARKKTKAQ